ncbi:DUF2000 family protein [Geomonas subterranea]|uniref:DUF2000 family protein n=1 Tax=Geomonas subterranea TaxID=2847989 RepID=UPI001CD4BB67|nr:DUF2000 family protein [Geomonas fuzhouensis]
MHFDTKIVVVIDENLAVWQKLNVTAFLTSGVIASHEEMIGQQYKDASGKTYSPLCVQPIMIMKTNRDRLKTILTRANNEEIVSSIYIEDMFATGFDEANRQTVSNYNSQELPLVGIAMRGEKKCIDKVVKGAKLHD